MVLQVPLDFILLLAAGMSAFYARLTPWAVAIRPVMFGLSLSAYLSIVTLVGLAWIVLFAIAGLYTPDPNRRLAADFYRIFLACSAGLAGVALYLLFTQSVFDSRFLVAMSWLLAMVYVSVGRLLSRGIKSLLYRLGVCRRRVILIGENAVSQALSAAFHGHSALGYHLLGLFPSFANALSEQAFAHEVDEIIFTNPRGETSDTLSAIQFCAERSIVFKYSADLFATYATNMTVQPVAGIPIVEIRRTRLEGWGRVIKRGFDVLVSILAMLILSPIMLATALVILLETGRPVIYKNERVGPKGKVFFILKFRSMCQKDCTGAQFGEAGLAALKKEAELIATRNIKFGPVYKIADDPRVTPFGRFIRRASIDELPQLLNVLIGNMSLVGPRPHQPREVAQYESDQAKVLTIKPGITGLAQISGRSDLSFADEVRLDVFYIENWSWWLDFIICLKTPFIIFRKRKAL